MPSKTDTRERMLKTTATLLRRQGYAATGIHEILAAAEAPRGSLYHHFPGGKPQLATEALARAGAGLGRLLARAMEMAPSAAEGVRAMAKAQARQLVDTEFLEGCPIATVALETTGSEPMVEQAAAAAFEEWLEIIARRIEADGFPLERARDLAVVSLAGLEGAMLLARTRRDPAPLRLTADALASLLEVRTTAP